MELESSTFKAGIIVVLIHTVSLPMSPKNHGTKLQVVRSHPLQPSPRAPSPLGHQAIGTSQTSVRSSPAQELESYRHSFIARKLHLNYQKHNLHPIVSLCEVSVPHQELWPIHLLLLMHIPDTEHGHSEVLRKGVSKAASLNKESLKQHRKAGRAPHDSFEMPDLSN